MQGIENIARRIAEDTQREIARLEQESRAEAEEILAQARAQAQRERDEILARGEKQAREREERLESAARMQTGKLCLAAKQEVIGEAFQLALEQLCALPEQAYIALLARLAVRCSSTGKEQLIFSPADRARLGKQVVTAANDALVKQVTPELPEILSASRVGGLLEKMVSTTTAMLSGTGMLTLSQETRPMRGGVILADGDVELNCSFETLVRLQREKLELDVARLLFP